MSSRGSDTIFNEIKTSFKTVNDHFIEDKQRNSLFGLDALDLANNTSGNLLSMVCNHPHFTSTTGLALYNNGNNAGSTPITDTLILEKIFSIKDVDTTSGKLYQIGKVQSMNTLGSSLRNSDFIYNYDALNINFSRLLIDPNSPDNTMVNKVFLYTKQFQLLLNNIVEFTSESDPTNSPTVCPAPPNGSPTISTNTGLSEPKDFDNLLDLLNCIRVTYNFLDPVNFQKYKSNISNPKPPGLIINTYEFMSKDEAAAKYDIQVDAGKEGIYQIVYDTERIDVPDSGPSRVQAIKEGMKNAYEEGTRPDYIVKKYVSRIINNIRTLDPTSTRVDAIRRILLAYEMMIHIIIASTLFTRPIQGDTNVVTTKNVFRNLLEICILNFVNLNIEFVNSVNRQGDSNNPTIYDTLNNAKRDYIQKKKNLNMLSGDLKNVKKSIHREMDLTEVNKYFYTRTSIVFYIYVILFIFILIGLAVIHSGVGNMSDVMKLRLSVGMILFSVVLLVALYLANRYFIVTTESFQDSGVDIITQTQLDNQLYVYYIANNTFSEYMINTINLLHMLDALSSYTNVTNSIHNENTYYTYYQHQLRQNKERINSVQVESFRQAKILQYRTYLFTELLILASVYMSIFVYAKHYFFGIIAFIVFLLLVYKYVYNVNNLVRTDGTKMYWDGINENGDSGTCLVKV